MSQSATFYAIDENDFFAIKSDPNKLGLLKDRENNVTFQGTHEGIRFILSKGLDEQKAFLVNEIFYPTTFIGEVSQYVFPNAAKDSQEFVDVTNDESYEDFDRAPISFLDPEKVMQIASFLDSVSSEQFSSKFNPVELNKKDIYPCCWNTEKGDEYVYNEKHIAEDFQNLKKLFNSASRANSYLLCFVG